MQSQLDLFGEVTEFQVFKEELDKVKQANENVRRGLFARHNELFKLYQKQQEEIENLKLVLAKVGYSL